MDLKESETLDAGVVPARDAWPSCHAGDLLSGRYRLEEEIGRGGMGVVFRAWDVELERPVAVKVVGGALDGGAGRERLLREARAAAALRHPHVVSVHDVGDHGGMPFFVMELVDAPSLETRPPRSLAEIITVATQICSALEHAHAVGLVHRDLKPANVLLEQLDGTPAAKIVDLGLAVSERGVRLTRDGGLVGTVAYMAPEQALGRDVDGRTDLYALGVMLYELATGRVPFDGDSALAVLSQHLHAPPVPPRAWREDLPAPFEEVVLRLLAKDPGQRFATAGEVARALTAIRDASPAVIGAPAAALCGLVRGRLVGRDAELGALRGAWTRAASGSGGMVLISGEPGSGKSRLARELLDYARITGGAVLAGGCYELEAATPYLPFLEAIRAWVRQTPDDRLRQAVGDAAPELARLAPELASRLGPFETGPGLSPAEERLRLFDGVARFLLARAASGGLLLFVDDLQWADEASLSLLRYLVRLAAAERLLIVGCYRETELDRAHPLAGTLDLWSRERAAERLHLKRLQPEGTAALLNVLLGEGRLSEELSSGIHRETDGNPFFIEELVKTLVEEGQIIREGGEWRRCAAGGALVLPQGVKAAIGRRLDHVGAATAEMLRTAAVLGKVFDFSELAATTDVPEPELLDAVDEAVAAQLLETTGGETIRFTHDKIREVLYHELNPIRRRRLHGRVAAGLEALGTSAGGVAVEDLAHHAMESGDLDRGLDWGVAAAREAAAVHAWGDSLRLYERARECAETLGREPDIIAIDTAMGEVFTLKGEPKAAAERYHLALSATSDPAEQLRLRCLIGDALVILGDARALDYAAQARTALDPETQPAELARATMIEARFHHYRGQSRTASERFLEALEPAERSGDPAVLGWLYGYLAGAHQHLIDFDESDRWAERAIALGRREDDPGIESIGVEFLMENAAMRGRWTAVLDHAERHRALGDKARSSDRLAWNHLGVALAQVGRGELAAAEATCDAGIELAERLDDERLALFLGGSKAQAAAERGRHDEAAALVEHWLGRAIALGLKSGHAECLRAAALVAQRAGDHDAVLVASDALDELLEGTDESIFPVWTGPTTCRSLIARGRLEDAKARLETTLAASRRAGMVHWEGVTLTARGALHLARGDAAAARADLDRAVEILAELGSRLELARALAMRASVGSDPSADLDRARTLAEACGAALELSHPAVG